MSAHPHPSFSRVVSADGRSRTSRIAVAATVILAATVQAQDRRYSIVGTLGTEFGSTMVAMPDITGDSRIDFAIADPATGNGQVKLYAGLNGTFVKTLAGSVAGERFGAAIDSHCHSLDRTLIVGAPGTTIGGTVYVYQTSAMNLVRKHVGGTLTYAGASVAMLGDLDDDFFDDYAIGAPNRLGFVMLSGVTVYSGKTGKVLHSKTKGGNTGFGSAMRRIGDVDGDRYEDLMVLSSFQNGMLEIYSGKSFALLRTIQGTATEQVTNAFDGIGDVDHDGHGDYVIGFPAYNTGAGRVRAYSGRTGATLWTRQASLFADGYGTSVAGCGDFDLDDHPDVVVGSPGYDSGRQLNVGRVVILSGKDGRTLQTYVGASDNKIGKSVASANDVKSDATTGFAMQAITPGPSVRVHVHRSLPSPFTRILRLKSGAQPQQFGHAVDGGFDFDADGVRDFVTGSPFDSLAAKSGGGVTFFSGATGNPVHVIHGAIANAELGASLACIDDLDGDGHGDLVAGAAAILDQSQKGAVLAFSGKTGSKLYRIEGRNAGDAFGFRVTAIGDIDHDGFDDWAAIPAFGDYAELRSGRDGSLLHSIRPPLGKTYGIAGGGDIDADGVPDVLITTLFNTTRFNYVYAYSGRTGVLLQTHAGRSDDDFGRGTAILGDIDDDGHADYVLGVRYGGHVYSGRAEFVSGKTGSTIDTLHGSFLRDGFGFPVRAIGDANGNGTPDVAIAAVGGSTTGYVRVFDGATRQLISTSAGLEQGLFGSSVGAAGDLDNDGCLDLVIGAPFSAGSKGSIYVNSEPTVASRPRSSVFGHGCLSAGNTIPRIGIEGRAAIGTTMTMTVRGVPRNTAALFRLGFQKADIDLGIIGMPNCRAYVLPIVDFGLATTTDRTAEFALPIRNETRFVGAELFFQWFALDSKANALGIIASDAMRSVIGLQ